MGAHTMSVPTMAKTRNSIRGPASAVRQIAGPLDGYRLGATDVPVRIYDLTLDGCLVEMGFGTLSGKDVRLQIDLPDDGWIMVHCEPLHIAGHNAFAVKFIRLDEDTRRRIGRALDRLSDRPSEDDPSVINGEANDD